MKNVYKLYKQGGYPIIIPDNTLRAMSSESPLPVEAAVSDSGGGGKHKAEHSSSASSPSAAAASPHRAPISEEEEKGGGGAGVGTAASRLFEAAEHNLPTIGSDEMPLVPPRLKLNSIEVTHKTIEEKEETWMYVKSPREVYGVQGPLGIPQLRSLYQMGDIQDKTLVWTDGKTQWQPLGGIPTLRYQLLPMPDVPNRKVTELAANALKNPILPAPDDATIDASVPLHTDDKFNLFNTCARCGFVAVTHAPGQSDQNIETMLVVPRINFHFLCVYEILPGLLWIGNEESTDVCLKMEISLAVNCTYDVPNPPDKRPVFRAKSVPLPFAPIPASDPRTKMILAPSLEPDHAPTVSCDMENLMRSFDKAFDTFEMERLYRYRATETEIPEVPKRRVGPVDEFGRPRLNKQEQLDAIAVRKVAHFVKDQAPRILVWGPGGNNRCCVLVAAYLIKRWGVKLKYALDYIGKIRKGMVIEPLYMEALQEWERRHVLGELLCEDCLAGGSHPEKKYSNRIYETVIDSASSLLKTASSSQLARLPEARRFLLCNTSIPHPSRAATLKVVNDLLSAPPIIELSIGGYNLGDEGVKALVDVLAESGAFKYMERMDLKHNCIGSEGCEYLVRRMKAFFAGKTNDILLSVDLSHNRISAAGTIHVANLLLICSSVLSLDVSNNGIDDAGAATLLDVLVHPNEDIFEEDDDAKAENGTTDEDAGQALYSKKKINMSLTDINISNNRIGRASFDMIAGIAKSNPAVTAITLDYNLPPSSKDTHLMYFNLKNFNRSLRNLSMNHIKLTIENLVDIFSIFEGDCPISNLSLIDCGISQSHMARAASLLYKSKTLRYLNLGHNRFGDEGLSHLTKAIRTVAESPLLLGFSKTVLNMNAREVEREVSQFKGLNLIMLDVSCTGISTEGAFELLQALALNHTVQDIDLSDNDFGTECMTKLAPTILRCTNLLRFRINRCNLQARGAGMLLKSLTDFGLSLDLNSIDNKGIRTLELSGNCIKNSFARNLQPFLEVYNLIQVLDLSCNELTDDGLSDVRSALIVTSSSPALRRLNELNIVLTGNPCDPCILDFPNMSRAKANMFFGSDLPMGAAHVNINARDSYAQQSRMQQKLKVEGRFEDRSNLA